MNPVVFLLLVLLTACVPSLPKAFTPATNGVPIEINSTPMGAVVYIDGKDAGASPVITQVDAGRHQIKLTKSSFQSFEITVDVKPNNPNKIDIKLQKSH